MNQHKGKVDLKHFPQFFLSGRTSAFFCANSKFISICFWNVVMYRVHLVMGCPNARVGVIIVKKKKPLRAIQISWQLITTSGIAVGVALVVPILD